MNVKQISINTILPQIVILYVVLVIWLCFFVTIFKKITVKTVIFSLLYTPYLMTSILWELCFITESVFLILIPAYPLMLYLVIKIGIKHRNKGYM